MAATRLASVRPRESDVLHNQNRVSAILLTIRKPRQ